MKAVYNLLGFIFIALIVLSSCTRKVYYGSGDCSSLSATMATIEMGIMQQYPQYIPNDIEVTDEFVKWFTNETQGSYARGYGLAIYEKTNIIYYHLIEAVELKKVQRHYRTVVITENGGKFGFTLKDIEKAKQLCQAFECAAKK